MLCCVPAESYTLRHSHAYIHFSATYRDCLPYAFLSFQPRLFSQCQCQPLPKHRHSSIPLYHRYHSNPSDQYHKCIHFLLLLPEIEAIQYRWKFTTVIQTFYHTPMRPDPTDLILLSILQGHSNTMPQRHPHPHLHRRTYTPWPSWSIPKAQSCSFSSTYRGSPIHP